MGGQVSKLIPGETILGSSPSGSDENKDPYSPVSTSSSSPDKEIMDENDTPIRNPRLKALNSDPRSPSGLPRTPILVEEDPNSLSSPNRPIQRLAHARHHHPVEASCRSPLLIENEDAETEVKKRIPKNLNESLDESVVI
eukprot:TRINITY_DN7720_c0_g1_i1.p1 TRINITY_DN7720_c0_g1~~TRINITY_DN7720_c0_g1_i1.p1  ORF type:complete len:140 (+),score=46.32 TRINITY_DN7720_c0_g1_i1:105-524(+)